MKVIEQSHEILSISEDVLQAIERAGRTCYKSEDKITPTSAEKFVEMLIKRGHHAMIEFGTITVKFITNRGVTHELVRHRMCSFAETSTRYCNYGGKDIEFIKPVWIGEHWSANEYGAWMRAMFSTENQYKQLLECGWRPEQAREVLPNSLKTEIVVQANIREWRHILQLRTARAAHPQIRALMLGLLRELQGRVPVVFDDIGGGGE